MLIILQALQIQGSVQGIVPNVRDSPWMLTQYSKMPVRNKKQGIKCKHIEDK
jgi:hypothetical protein